MRIRHIMVALILSTSTALADEPLPPPEKVVSCSLSGSICAESDPVTSRTIVVSKPSGKVLWSLPGWHRKLLVAEGGDSVAVGFDGLNLVPPDSNLQLEVLHFYNRGKLVRSVKLSDLYRDRSQLLRTVSHLAWMNTVNVNRANQLVLELVSGRRIAFSMTTGESQPEAGNAP